MNTKNIEIATLWAGLSAGERHLICAIMRMLKGARRSQIADVARAAAKWERGIAFFIKVRLTHQRPRRLPPNTGWIEIESRPVASSSSSSSSSPVPVRLAPH